MKYINNIVAIFCVVLLFSCNTDKKTAEQNTDTTTLKFTASEDTAWTNLFFRKHGWFGADGIFSIPLNGVDTVGANNATMLFFSDTMLGDIDGDSLRKGFVMIHNSVAYVNGNTVDTTTTEFYWDSANNKAVSLFAPNSANAKPKDYFWLGDGFFNKQLNATYLFAYRIRDTSTATFGFAEVGNTLIKIPAGSKPPFKDAVQTETPLYIRDTTDTYGSFGAGIFPNTEDAGYKNADGYIYVYGVRGKAKNVMVARVKPEDFESFDKWRFWDGKEWNADISKVINITNRASNELSVSQLPDGRYAMIFQTDGIGRNVGLRLSNHPQGPFGPIIDLWYCKEPDEKKDFIVYNAKAHPNLSKPGELLISYNVNSFDFWNDVYTHPNLYRPRFIKIKLLQ